MKVRTVGMLAAAAMTLTSMTVWSVTPAGGFGERARTVVGLDGVKFDLNADSIQPWKFEAGTNLMVEGRVGHATMQADRNNETYLYLNVKAPAGAVAAQPAPANLAIVIDKSGSMQGKRLRNAKDAAREMVRRMNDGDMVSVVTYNTKSEILVQPTTVSASSRQNVIDAIDKIQAAGDTCISCGIDSSMALLRGRTGMVNRILLLSDGEATAGVRDVEGFRKIATRARDMDCAISSIGVDVQYNERIMSVIASQSNGRHYFVEDASGLTSIFDRELNALSRTVASAGELRVDLAPGVSLAEVFDRDFRREGNTIVIPMGTFSSGEQKTALVRVRLARGAEGTRSLANVSLGFNDLISGEHGSCDGTLSALLSSDSSSVSQLDPLVAGRLGRTETAATLREANRLFAQGSIGDARDKLTSARTRISKSKDAFGNAAPLGRGGEVKGDFDRQLAALDEAEVGFASPPPAAAGQPAPLPQQSRKGRSQVRRNAERAADMGF